jgi:hypothetical protein
LPGAAFVILTTYIRIEEEKGSFSRRNAAGKGSRAWFIQNVTDDTAIILVEALGLEPRSDPDDIGAALAN